MIHTRRLRGIVLRLTRRRASCIVVGTMLLLPAVWVQWSRQDVTWWIEGLSLVTGATGVALLWTGVAGVTPDWIDDN